MAEITARSPGEPYRAYLLYAAERLTATRTRNADLDYGSPAEFVADLRLVQASLADAGAARQAYGELQHLIWQAETFGFHLASLEVRQHSAVHARALAELRAGGELSPMTLEVLETIRVIGWIQNRFGFAACHRYVISFTTAASDVAAVYELAGYAFPDGGGPVLDVVPLFESGDDLAAAPSVLTGMLELDPVRERLAANGRQLEVMLGYSDSAKELGPASATLRLFEAQAELASWAAAHDVALTLFHGRGGAIGRGGGPAGRAVLAQAPGSVSGRLKVTEQGEVIFARYGRHSIGLRHLEQVTSAVLLASSPSLGERNAAAAGEFRALASSIDVAAKSAFRGLAEADGFAEWFATVSPLGEIGGLRIGSRPSQARPRRRAARPGGPARHPLGVRLGADPAEPARLVRPRQRPGGGGLDRHRGGRLRRRPSRGGDRRAAPRVQGVAAARHPARQRRDVAGQDRPRDRRPVPGPRRQARPDRSRVLAEYDLTRRLVLAITEHDLPVADRQVLARAIVLRDPYVDALSYLQLRALTALRAEDVDPAERAALERLLLLTISGVAAGLQNTG